MTRPTPKHAAADDPYDRSRIEEEIVALREWWGELAEMGLPHFGEMGSRLARFRIHLSEHFKHVEGRDHSVGQTRRDRAGPSEVSSSRHEHEATLAALDRLVARLTSREQAIACWGEARQELEDLLDQLD